MAEAARKRHRSRKGPTQSYRDENFFPPLSDSDDSEHSTGTLGSERESGSDLMVEKQEEGYEGDPDNFAPDPEEEEEEDIPEDAVVEDLDLPFDDPPFEDEVVPRGEEIIEVDYSDAQTDPDSPGDGRNKHRTPLNTPKVATRRKVKVRRSQLNSAGELVTKVRQHVRGIERVHPRGVEQFGRGGGLEVRLKDLFGPTNEDLKPTLETRDWWDFQETLPSRAGGSLRRSFHISDGAREREIQNMATWYSGDGKARFANEQGTLILDREKGETYMVNPGPASMNVLMGQSNDPLLYNMKKGSFLSTATPFIAKEDRRGWIFNLGSQIREAQWATNEEGSTQYLAVAVEQVETTHHKHKPLENPEAPAFSVTTKFPASIQIWAVDATKEDSLDPGNPPRLELVICTDWGAPKHFRWCPLAFFDNEERSGDESIAHLGLLAGFWSDGRVRILDISYPKPDPESFETRYMHYFRAAFDVQIPLTIPTCLHWLSGTSLAVATTSGALAIWTLSRPETFRPPGVEHYNPRPWFYRKVADTYILSLSSGYPSRPNFISYTTASGFSKLLDLRSPLIDICTSSRGRNLTLTQAWHEQTQAFIMSDENYMLRSNSLRRYYTNIYNMRSESSIACCATSPVQPAILVGSVDGTVQASNPIARLMNVKELPWQQTWFKHEWRPSVGKLPLKPIVLESCEEENEEMPDIPNAPQFPTLTTNPNAKILSGIAPTSSSTSVPKLKPKITREVLSQPLARITEGYRVQQVSLAFPKPYDTPTAGGKYVTIFEELSGVTTVAWNPNLRFGTWAVAGMCDGLLRVEDLNV
ncbi:hypothetical protein K505DRAFT_409198 [Melanomma pulvis-pyrius CBS 109.77]|uniref:Transcription factor tfiiic complex subunit tfc6 n=1 Tax=Melanomma pulvis-pyrius CBS 109.77 TaxID=1314802 RepID=A0A6A6X6E3_9PLEO|nr:hypothetical protein K505DRAFT_409198 [Melanomma pulvis-pyrius CBS 109.77]